jgi:hypothetical protein
MTPQPKIPAPVSLPSWKYRKSEDKFGLLWIRGILASCKLFAEWVSIRMYCSYLFKYNMSLKPEYSAELRDSDIKTEEKARLA